MVNSCDYVSLDRKKSSIPVPVAVLRPVDLEFDRKTGAITALIVPGPGKFCFFPGRESEYIIPWCRICQIGDDIILVEVKEEKCFHKDHLLWHCQGLLIFIFFPEKNISCPPWESFLVPEIRDEEDILMALNKVEICGVNTSSLPILKSDEKEALFQKIKKEILKPANNISKEISALC